MKRVPLGLSLGGRVLWTVAPTQTFCALLMLWSTWWSHWLPKLKAREARHVILLITPPNFSYIPLGLPPVCPCLPPASSTFWQEMNNHEHRGSVKERPQLICLHYRRKKTLLGTFRRYKIWFLMIVEKIVEQFMVELRHTFIHFFVICCLLAWVVNKIFGFYHQTRGFNFIMYF